MSQSWRQAGSVKETQTSVNIILFRPAGTVTVPAEQRVSSGNSNKEKNSDSSSWHNIWPVQFLNAYFNNTSHLSLVLENVIILKTFWHSNTTPFIVKKTTDRTAGTASLRERLNWLYIKDTMRSLIICTARQILESDRGGQDGKVIYNTFRHDKFLQHFGWKSEVKTLLRCGRRRGKGNIKRGFKKQVWECVDWIHLAQDGTCGELLWTREWIFRYHETRDFLDYLRAVIGSYNEFYSMELVAYSVIN
jgi:hypothetical protein